MASHLSTPPRARLRERAIPILGMVAAIAVLHVVGFGLLIGSHVGAAPGTATLGIGIGLTAYTLGLRHAFDADHIAAIDNTTRKLVNDGRAPVSVGFFFSLGHSTVVLGLTVLLALGVHALAGPIEDDSSALHQVTGIIGTTVSGVFLYVIAGINIVLLVMGWRAYRRAKNADADAEVPTPRGPFTAVFGKVMGFIKKPWQMYPLGVLFGFGFDTATEIGLLVLAATSAAAGLPWYALLALPLLFAAGMSLLDTADGLFMRYAYGWAFASPARKMTYNLAITLLSAIIAVAVGTAEILGLIGERMQLTGPFWDWIASVDLNAIGFVIVGLLAVVWVTALLIWRIGNIKNPRARQAA